LSPGEQRILPEAIDFLRKVAGVAIGPAGLADYGGALRVSVSGVPVGMAFAGARTASQSPGGGQFGLFTPGIYEGQGAQEEAWLFGLRADADNRSNVAVAHAGIEGSLPVTLELQAFDGDAGGEPRGPTTQLTLNAGEWTQISGFLGSNGIRSGWVRISRTSGSAPWIAYGVINDGNAPGERTGDGAYVPMVPATHTP
jgi:hypothetical protein